MKICERSVLTTGRVLTRAVVVVLSVALLSSCSSGRGVPVHPASDDIGLTTSKEQLVAKRKVRPADQVAPGYLIQISNPDDEKLNGKFRVGYDGVLQLPYEISIGTSGLNETELRQRIVKAYKDFFAAEPNIQMSIVEKQYYVEVAGLVEKPGRYIVDSTSSLGELIAQAGGLQQTVATETIANYVRIEQLGTTFVVRLRDYYSGEKGIVPNWQGGDLVFFQSQRGSVESSAGFEHPFVQLLGQVINPGEYGYKSGDDFYKYLVRAGGPSERADLSRVVLYRAIDGQTQPFEYDIEEGGLPEVRPGDVFLVHADNPTRLEKRTRYIAEVAGIVGTIATLAILIVAL